MCVIACDTNDKFAHVQVKGKVFIMAGTAGSNYGSCKDLWAAHDAQLFATTFAKYGSKEWGKILQRNGAKEWVTIDTVLQKTQVGHPQRASPHEGFVGFKRLVMHKTKANETKADVMKVSC